MGKLHKFLRNVEDLKLAIMDYKGKDIDLIYRSPKYYQSYWKVFKRKTDRKQITPEAFDERLCSYLWTPKVSELLTILFILDQDKHIPSVYELNALLRRTSNQYSSTLKAVEKLEELGIVKSTFSKGPGRAYRRIQLNEGLVCLYGDDEFRKMMLEGWNTDAKEYIRKKHKNLSMDRRQMTDDVRKRMKKVGERE